MRREPVFGEKHMAFSGRLFAGRFCRSRTTQVAAQENLGRLFFTEQQRQDSTAAARRTSGKLR